MSSQGKIGGPRVRAAVGGVTAAVVALLGVAAATPSAEAASCVATKTSTMTVHATEYEYEYDTMLDRSGHISTSPRRYLNDGGSKGMQVAHHSITVLACKNATTKKWSPLSIQVTPRHNDLSYVVKNGNATVSSAGTGVTIPKITSTRVYLDAIACGKKPQPLSALGVVRGLTRIPVPAPYWVAVGQAVLGAVLPSSGTKYTCGGIGAQASATWKFSTSGVASLSFGSTAHALRYTSVTWEESPGPFYVSFETTHQFVVNMTK
ncbi:hypothetical protein [Luteimicrobium subarcticum]|uniref:Secreted protein n=1 Tax=Luteimicrobium subarcticum TaxID=620910 RepID=A0A2M8W724_9MICO|nr:hypothetical protein [Luteimicrobium subarcticum]PJI86737.1 hypothetical protein CLV34_2660 [Luteimicrobium subarcticum]